MRFLIRKIFSLAVLVIGIFMVARYAGSTLPPLLSGIAFILIGLTLLMKK
jgi:xanthine/uracil permease